VRCLLCNLWTTEEGNHEDKIIGNGDRSCSTGTVCRSSPHSAVPSKDGARLHDEQGDAESRYPLPQGERLQYLRRKIMP
jgi:hypothetical protein